MDIQALHGAVQPSVERVQAARPAPVKPAEAPAPKKAPVYDEYVPEEPSAKQSAGIYQIAHDEDGTPRIRFDDPEKKEAASSGAPESKAETTTCNTDAVDREIEKLRKDSEQLEQQLRSAAGDPEKAEKLEKELDQVQRELQQKDNDGYRRQHAVFS